MLVLVVPDGTISHAAVLPLTYAVCQVAYCDDGEAAVLIVLC